MFDYLVVGAGLFGSVFAREMTDRGKSCLVIEKRDHIGGNCYSVRKDGIDVHLHGPHIFHTDNLELWNYVNRYGNFVNYRHTVKASCKGKLYSFPINLTTLRQVFGEQSDASALAKMEMDRKPFQNTPPDNLENWCLARIGPRLYNMFIRGYTTKVWQMPPRELEASVVKRLPIRKVADDNYYRHKYQGIPLEGYTQVFENMLKGIEVRLDSDYFGDRKFWNAKAHNIVFTGEIDRFFDYRHGELDWRSLNFVSDTYEMCDKQGVAQINFTDETVPHIRSVEYRHLMPNIPIDVGVTHVVKEFPSTLSETGEAYYPVPTVANRSRYQRYNDMASGLGDRFIFGGRLARYVYIDMAPTIRMALNTVRRELMNTQEVRDPKGKLQECNL